MLILVINSGSSSIKFRIFRKTGTRFDLLSKGIADAIGLKNSELLLQNNGQSKTIREPIANHHIGLKMILDNLYKFNFLSPKAKIDMIGHRIVHGGEKFKNPLLITTKILGEIKKIAHLAPLHHRANISCLEACIKLFPKTPQVTIFDTAFHKTLPPTAYLYALPNDLYRRFGLRRYGFHGINHQYVSEEATRLLKKSRKPSRKIISIHLGNGCSVSAIKDGRSIENSMGYTPLEGLVMGTRSGDLDPALIPIIGEKLKKNLPATIDLLNKQSGLLGMSEISSDMRTIWDAVQKGNPKATQALDSFCYRIGKYINAYIGILGGIDAIIFTGGIGEHAWYVRERVTKYLKHLNIKLDNRRNKACAQVISNSSSSASVIIIPANEELAIARQVSQLLSKKT